MAALTDFVNDYITYLNDNLQSLVFVRDRVNDPDPEVRRAFALYGEMVIEGLRLRMTEFSDIIQTILNEDHTEPGEMQTVGPMIPFITQEFAQRMVQMREAITDLRAPNDPT